MTHLFQPIKEFPVVTRTDRDCEIPVLREYLARIGKQFSLLDVGCHWSHAYYADYVRPLISRYDGIDILDDEKTKKIVDNYYVGNVNTWDFGGTLYDVVLCISSIEHAGISTYKGEHKYERIAVFDKCLSLSKKHMFVTFPVGKTYIYPGELAVIDRNDFSVMETLVKTIGATMKKRFFWSQGPQSGHPWQEHEDEELALSVPYISTVGAQSLAILEIEK